MTKRWWLVALLLLCAGTATAGGARAVRKQIEATMLVEGTIDVDADGRVVRFDIKRRDRLQPAVAGLIDDSVPTWRFEPIALQPGAAGARADMSLRLVARKLDDGGVMVAIRGAQFGHHAPDEQPKAGRMTPPRYPKSLMFSGVGGTAYLLLKVGRDGRVDDAVAEQVNLRAVASENVMQGWRQQLAQSALSAARGWTFSPPTTGPEVDRPYWTVRVPVDFLMCEGDSVSDCPKQDEYAWHSYIPGPRLKAPWETGEPEAAADAVASGGAHSVDPAFRLLTALDPS